MTVITAHSDETRTDFLRTHHLMNSTSEDVFDRVTQLVARLFGAPIALVTFVDRDSLRLKSRVGLNFLEIPRERSFCSHAICDAKVLVISDAQADPRFADGPLVLDAPYVRFYAGAPIFSSRGIALGTLCVMDSQPRELSVADVQTLQDLAEMVRREIFHRESAHTSRLMQRISHRAVEDSEARFRATFEQAAVGIALVAINGTWLRVNAKLASILGYAESELMQLTFQDITHPDDIEDDMALVQQMLRGEIVQYVLEKRYILKNGELVWVSLTVALLRDGAGEPLHFISVVEDIHARKEAEQALLKLQHSLEDRVQERTLQLQQVNDRLYRVIEEQHQAEALLRANQALLHTLVNVLPMYISYVDMDLTIRFINETFRANAAISPDFVVGKKLPEVLSSFQYDSIQSHLALVLAGGQVAFDALTAHEEERQWRVVFIPDRQNDKVVGFYIVSEDVTEQKRREALLQRKALRDSLTGLPNRRALLDRLETAVSRSDRSGDSIAVLFLDLDGFKAINDGYGHDGGDRVLIHFAQRLKRCVRDSDTVSRLGGDEFVIVLEALKNGSVDAQHVGEKILHSMREPFTVLDDARSLSSSIGVYVREPGCAVDAAHMIAQADKAMYQAKRDGKNRMHFALELSAALIKKSSPK